MLDSKFRELSGSTLLMVLVVMSIVLVIALSSSAISNQDYKNQGAAYQSKECMRQAQSGINEALRVIDSVTEDKATIDSLPFPACTNANFMADSQVKKCAYVTNGLSCSAGVTIPTQKFAYCIYNHNEDFSWKNLNQDQSVTIPLRTPGIGPASISVTFTGKAIFEFSLINRLTSGQQKVSFQEKGIVVAPNSSRACSPSTLPNKTSSYTATYNSSTDTTTFSIPTPPTSPSDELSIRITPRCTSMQNLQISPVGGALPLQYYEIKSTCLNNPNGREITAKYGPIQAPGIFDFSIFNGSQTEPFPVN